MAKRTFLAGATSQTVDVFLQDSSSTIGAGLSGLAFNTANLKAYYRKGATGTLTAITLATQTVGGAWSSGGFVEIDATNAKGLYRFDIPDTILASTPYAVIHFYGALNLAQNFSELEIVSYNPFDAVRLGLTALPNAAAEAAGGLYTRGSGAGQINQNANGSIDTNTKTWNGLTTVALPLIPTVAGRTLDCSAGGEAGVDWANVGTPGSAVNLSSTTVNLTNTVTTYTGNTPQTGDVYIRLGAPAGVTTAADIAAVKADTAAVKVTTDKFVFTVANQVDSNVMTKTGFSLSATGLDTIVMRDLGAVPSATATFPDGVSFMFMAQRNARVTDSGAGTDVVSNTAGAVIATAALTDAAGVFTKAKYA